ncbi:MAG: hypothetical protein HYV09_29415 [Deltaproteobacteria bacterium]|nr:hypothetical protein [Deltaproteobacteria bacterium]
MAAAGAFALAGCHAHVGSSASVRTWTAPPAEYPAEYPVEYPVEYVVGGDYDDADPICIQTFHTTLAQHGTWIEDEEAGLVWVPDPAIVGVGFVPYLSTGRWIHTSHGYFWESEHSWGWVTFHYGRWVRTAYWGWAWVPGARYSPAWVDWRYGSGWIGWSPSRPGWSFRGGMAYQVDLAPSPYVFVHSSAFFSPYLTVVVAPPAHRSALLAATSVWTAPPAPRGARPFLGPDPILVGIPRADVVRATAKVPDHVLPQAVPWGITPQPPIITPSPKAPPFAPAPAPPALVPAPAPSPKPPAVVPMPFPKSPKATPPKAKPPSSPKAPKPKPGPLSFP